MGNLNIDWMSGPVECKMYIAMVKNDCQGVSVTYSWECKNCGEETETSQSIHDPAVLPPTIECMSCQNTEWARIYVMPGVTRKSFLDGARKDRDWLEMKEAAKLEVQKAGSNDVEERVELGKRIKKLRTPRK